VSSQTIASMDAGTKAKPPAPPTRPARSRWWRIAALLLALAAVGGGAWYFMHGRKAEESSEEARSASRGSASGAVAAEVVRPEPGGIPRISAMTGSVHPYESADLYANVSGYLKSQEVVIDGKTIPVDIGVHVKRGDLLAEIDVPEVIAEAEKAAADLEQAKAQAAQAAASVVTAQADQRAAEAAIKEAEADVGRYTAGRNQTFKAFRRYQGLRAQNAVEQDVVDQKEDAYESAVAAEKSAKAAIVTVEARVAAAKAKVDQAEADRKSAEANVDVARAKLKKAEALVAYTKIRSPYTGVITHREFFPGDFIRSASEGNSRPMLTVARTDLMRVVTKIADKDVPYADVGDPAVVTIDALPGEQFRGTIARFTEAEIPNERTMRTEIDLPNDPKSPAGGRLRDGMYGLATITLQPAGRHLVLPSACVTDRGEGNEGTVLVARDGHARAAKVRIGADDGVHVEVVSGLSADDEVIIPNGAVSDGTAINPTKAAVAGTGQGGHGH
jgi:RND family efflux transporter MFP subunit